MGLSGTLLNSWIERNYDHTSQTVSDICNVIETNTTEDECISVYGNWNLVYVKSHRLSATKYAYQFPVCYSNPEIMDEYIEELGEKLPKVVVVQGAIKNDAFLNILTGYGYSETYSNTDGDSVYVR